MVCAEFYIFNDCQDEVSLIEGSGCTKNNTCDFITFVTKIVVFNHTLFKKSTLKYKCASQQEWNWWLYI